MPTFSNRTPEELEQRILKIADYLPEDEDRYLQLEQWFSTCEPCCVGAHLAAMYGLITDKAFVPHYRRGREALAQDLGYIQPVGFQPDGMCALYDDLHACGAPSNPFGTQQWETHPKEVFRKLAARLKRKRALRRDVKVVGK